MKKNFFKYPLLLISVGIISLPITLGAGSKHAIALPVDQSQIDPTQIPQALRDFISQAIKQDLSVDQIVEQAVLQGYPKDQVISAYSVVMVQEVNEATSTQNTLMWCMLGATAIGIGVWLAYTLVTSKTAVGPDNNNPRIPGQHIDTHDDDIASNGSRENVVPNQPNNLRAQQVPKAAENNARAPRLEAQRMINMRPVPGYALAQQDLDRINQMVENGINADRHDDDIIREVEHAYPNIQFNPDIVISIDF